MRFVTRSNTLFANVLTETNHTIASRSNPPTKANMMSDLVFFLQYLIVIVAMLIIFMVWNEYTASWEDYSENCFSSRRHEDYEEWLQRHEQENIDETAPLFRRHRQDEGPLSPDEVLRLSNLLNDETDKLLRSVKEVPLSAQEVSRLTRLIQANDDNQPDYGSIVSRKRKAIDVDDSEDEVDERLYGNPPPRNVKITLRGRADDDDQSDHTPFKRKAVDIADSPDFNPEYFSNRRTQKLKIETDAGVTTPTRKRKAVDVVDSPDSHSEHFSNPRTQKLKIETDAGVNAKWVCSHFTRSPSLLGDSSGYSADCDVPFTFRAQYPGRDIKSPVGQRK
ncbi:MAG: hypothetical protein Q9221_002381 [Calogaya cf. arnoldii]